ncbi:MAG: LptF/LptG family permease [Planctomycetaceae bacterium]|nr:LptF/LptG family permease [Planctomycetaceae bacterium]
MRIIDRYLLRQFVQVFLICFSSLTGLYIVFDAFGNLDEFLRYAEKEGNLLGTMAQYYTYRSIFFFDRTSGVLALIAAMFTVTWIQRYNELTALLAAGLPTRRVMKPVFIAAIGISLVAAASREVIIPRISKQLGRDPKDLAGDLGRDLQPRPDHETGILFRGKQTFAKEQRIAEPNLLLRNALAEFGRQITAKDAFYQPANADHAGGYLLRGVREPADLATRASARLGDRAVIITPQDAPWLEPDECFVASNMTFDQLTGGSQWRQFSSTWQLVRGLRNPSLDFGADVRVAIHGRIVQPLLDVTLLFLGLPLVLTRENRNLFLAIGLCMVAVSLFMFVVLASQYIGGVSLVSPAFAAWLPLFIFVPVAVNLCEPLRA